MESLFIGSYIYHLDVIAGVQLCYKSSEIIQSTCPKQNDGMRWGDVNQMRFCVQSAGQEPIIILKQDVLQTLLSITTLETQKMDAS